MADFGSSIKDISNLSSLLNESRLSQELSEKHNQPPLSAEPTNVVLHQLTKTQGLNNVKKRKNDIWSPDEIPNEDAIACADTGDNRPPPRYEFSYSQTVGSEDTFLGLSDKTPLSSDCTHLIVKVHFPNCSLKDLDLDVTKDRIKVSSRTHKLFTYLPVSVCESKGQAKFDKIKEVLTVTLPIEHEY